MADSTEVVVVVVGVVAVMVVVIVEVVVDVIKLPACTGVVLVVSVVGWLLPGNKSAQFNLYHF